MTKPTSHTKFRIRPRLHGFFVASVLHRSLSQIGVDEKAAKLIARHLPNVLTYFKHRITNAVAEGLNSKIATVQKRACGFRNRDHFKIAIYFHCGGLDLYPSQVAHGKV